MSTEWKTISQTVEIPVYRTGWMGVWDALVSAVTGNDRVQFVKPFTLSFSANPATGVCIADVSFEKGKE